MSVYPTSLHFTSLHLFTLSPHLNSLACNYILNLLSKCFFILQGKDTSKLAGNWFQLLMVLFMKEYLPTSVLCFPVLIFRLWSPLLSMVLEVYLLSLSKPVPRCMPWKGRIIGLPIFAVPRFPNIHIHRPNRVNLHLTKLCKSSMLWKPRKIADIRISKINWHW
jgi:hypothetical protein